ncbi:triple tyrosine motif-containing protein [Sphingobacterium faecale]|uniref:Transcriptional regulator n=1 Tax=Sphingobacterium faecale TaxID=2803775 RepID=A0ABS1R8X4_9SPHI|nr:triple tyrosine motif-containing protein [Sphingobacterium faecale]MBL1411177.1 transcriptional regulator [Sphingobacterium faecale]
MEWATYIFCYFTLLFCAAPLLVQAQNIIRVGSPSIQQFDKTAYKAGNQNWSASVDDEGILYFGNTDGLLVFDGQYWKLYPLKNKSAVRSVKADKNGKIYVGGHAEFGYWQRKPYGHMAYTSISGLLEDKNILANDEIWKIIIRDEAVYFHSFSKIYVYKNNKINTITADGEPFLFPHLIQDRLYLEQIPSGLHLLQGQKLVPVKDKDILKNKNILCILPYNNDSYLLGTAHHGLFFLDKNGYIKKWDISAGHILAKAQINNGILLDNDQYAFGTIQDGVYILNKQGEILQHINKNNGLQNNTVLSITKDKQKNIWVGLDNGIDRIEVNSTLYFYTDFLGNIGTVYATAIFKGHIYLGTNQGLFVSPWNGIDTFQSLDFRQVSASSGQVWSLSVIGDKLLCGHNDGTFEVENMSFKKLSSVTGGWFFEKIPNSDLILQGNYTGISLFQKHPTVSFVQQYPSLREPIRFIVSKNQQNYWVGNRNNISLIELASDFKTFKTLIRTKHDSSINRIELTGVFNLEDNIVFTSDSGLYIYDDIIKKFKTHDELNKQLGSFQYANKIISTQKNQYWFFNRSRIAKIAFKQNGTITVDSTSLNGLQNRVMDYYENIYTIDKNHLLIGLDNGFAIYKEGLQEQEKLPLPIISGVWNISKDPILIDTSEIVVDYKNNNLRIAFSTPFYSTAPLEYQYFLEGYSEDWSSWDHTAYKDFTNLPAGKYVFQIRAKSANGVLSPVSTLAFKINNPWYLTWYALIIYMMTATLLFAFIRTHQRKKEQKRQFQIKRRLLEQQKATIAREAELNEQKLIKIKNQQLENELVVKNRELANAATNIVYKNEMLNNLHNQLKELKDAEGNRLSEEELRKINKLIDEAHNDDRDWDIFEKSFNEAHGNFFKKLKADFPTLVPNDLKLCAYLRLNMSSKEIASLLNITTRGVEIRRYRLRKKLNIPSEKNLSEFLLER